MAGEGTVRLGGGYVFLPVVSGFPGKHHLWTLAPRRGAISGGSSAPAWSTYRLWRRSNYTFNPDVDQNLSEARVFLSLAIPRWEVE